MITDKTVGEENRKIADMALFSFAKIVAKINKYTHILKYNRNQELQQKMTNYKVAMGLGLHQGWAIEGTIGSYHKIDASYLSANVNMAQRLEGATKNYGSQILVSEPMYAIMSKYVKTLCREIDYVQPSETSDELMRIYTTDLNTSNLQEVSDDMLYKSLTDKRKIELEERNKIWEINFKRKQLTTFKVITTDSDWVELRQNHSPDFNLHFREFYSLYLKGKWDRAIRMLDKLHQINSTDGPTLALKRYMLEEHKGKVPNDWKGFRPKWDF